jgi:retron-type reverse transcriptase
MAMLRVNHLYPLICERENLLEAFRKAACGKGATPEVIRFRQNLDANIERMRDELRDQTCEFGRYFFFTIRDPKVRKICAAAFPERVLHHAVMNVCEPSFESFYIHDSYACRKGKGNLRALERAKEFARRNAWYLKLDIRKYFDSIDHEVALRLLERRFKDRALLRLFERILDSYHVAPGTGIPIGNLFSQHLANLYLGLFDHWIKEVRKIRSYLRYMDDFAIFAEDGKTLKEELAAIRDFLRERLRLELKGNIQLNRTEFGMPFLGFRVFPAHIRLGKRAMLRFSGKYRRYERYYAEGLWAEHKLAEHMVSLCAFTQQGDCGHFRHLMIERFGVCA